MIATAPTTNIRLLIGLGMSVTFVLVNLIGGMMEPARVLPDPVFYGLGGFILLHLGIDVTHFGIKRSTFQPEAFKGGVVRESVDPAPSAPGAAAAPPAVPATDTRAYSTQDDDAMSSEVRIPPEQVERELPMRAASRGDVLVRDD